MNRCCSILLACCLWGVTAGNAFLLVPATQPASERRFFPSRRTIERTFPSFLPLSSSTNTDTADVEDGIRSMRVKELQQALADLNISTNDVFEKEELVQRLLTARTDGAATPSRMTTTTSTSSQRKKGSTTALVAPLYFTTMDANMKVAAVNMNNDGGITVNSSSQPYATMQIFVRPTSKSTISTTTAQFSLRLLLDTACSGLVLKPSVVQQYNLPQLSTPVTMTGAGGGTTGTTGGLTQLDCFSLHDDNKGDNDDDDIQNKVFGPLPAVFQDIGALPSSLDGIIGLSFLNQFAGVELDFEHGQLSLYQSWPPPSRSSPNDDQNHDQSLLVGRDILQTVSHLGIYTTNVYLGSRGPVKMLVDTGAANTFLSWKGVADLGLSRDSSDFVQRLNNPMGAMGSDNVVMQLTHRIYVNSKLCIGNTPSSSSSSQKASLPGLSLEGQKRLAIDIGDIAILEQLKSQGIGGILGIDALMRCSRVRLRLQGPEKIFELYSGDGSKGP